MNARQRRKAYRAMPKTGARVTYTTVFGVAVGTVECIVEYKNVRRVRVRLSNGTYCYPLAHNLRATGE